jgi:hypothetical protein
VTGSEDDETKGYTGDPDSMAGYPMPDRAEEEISKWYARHNYIWVEIGNEPNSKRWYEDWKDPVRKEKAELYIWRWQYWFTQTLNHLRARFPKATYISPGLQCRDEADRPIGERGSARWYELCKQAFSQADKVGFHVFGATDFYAAWNRAIIEELRAYYPNKRWFCTEYGINIQSEDITDGMKGWRYAGMVHFGRSDPPWPDQVEGAVYFHLDTRDPNGKYHIYEGGGDWGYRDRVNRG